MFNFLALSYALFHKIGPSCIFAVTFLCNPDETYITMFVR